MTHLMPVSTLAQTGMYSLVHISGRGLVQAICVSAAFDGTLPPAQPASAAHDMTNTARDRKLEILADMEFRL